MANPLFNMLGGNSVPNNKLGNFQQFVNRLNQFRQGFHGDAKQQVQQLLNSGKMTQAQYNQLSQLTNQIQQMLEQK